MRHSSNRRSLGSFAVAIVLTLTLLPLQAMGQTSASLFTVDDLLDVANVNIADLSDDGKIGRASCRERV